MTKYTLKQAANAGRNSAQAINTAESLIASRIEQMKAHLVACQGEPKTEKAFRQAWQARWIELRKCNDAAARKAYSRYKGAALRGDTGTQSDADKKAKAKVAKGAKAAKPSKGGKVLAQTIEVAPDAQEPSGNVMPLELAKGIGGNANEMLTILQEMDGPQANRLAALATSILRKAELAGGVQLS